VTPLISILLPAFKVAPFLRECLSSLLAQTEKRFEAIVINDCSPDAAEMEAIVAELQPQFGDRLRYISGEKNMGQASSRNLGASIARGEFFTLLDPDDIATPDFLHKLYEALQQNPQADVAHCDAFYFGSTQYAGRRYHEIWPGTTMEASVESLASRDCIIFVAAMIRRAAFDRCQGFRPGLRGNEDFDLWLRLARGGSRFHLVPEPLVHYRRHAGAISSSIESITQDRLRMVEQLLLEADYSAEQRASLEELDRTTRSELHLHRSKSGVMQGDKELALKEWDALLKIHPTLRHRAIRIALRMPMPLLRRMMRAPAN
jgi:glycosyltransferase involved in cell wall biosynthesis